MHVPPLPPANSREVSRHPRGLYTLFFTEMWERFSYYGMRALLVLFMVDAVQNGGLGLDDKTATAIYGLYTAFVYLVSLPGGWIGDRLLGAQRSVWIGGIIIAAGHFMLAIPSGSTFFLGLIVIVVGTGLLKPNMSVMVGHLYPEGGARRDAGFTIFYMGVNLGAAIGPLVCSFLGERFNWHYGFAAAGVGMVFGLVQFKLSARHLGEAGLHPHHRNNGGAPSGFDRAWYFVAAGLALLALAVALVWQGVIPIQPLALAKSMKYVIMGIGALFLLGIFAFGKLDSSERLRIGAILVLLIAAAVFWSGFEQAGSSLNLFADRYTDRFVSAFQFEIPTGWFQALNPVFIIALAPVFASLWVGLARRNLDLSIPGKFVVGLFQLALGFLIIAGAARIAVAGGKAQAAWLIATYLLHTTGEICLSPVGLSAVTKLAPPRFVGQMMGMWFLATSLGNLMAGLFAGEMSGDNASEMPATFLHIALQALIAGAVLLVFIRPMKRMLSGSWQKASATHVPDSPSHP
ncbi:peptide MFS transporter [soil metagenome]